MKVLRVTGIYRVDVARSDRVGITLSIITPDREETTFRFTNEEALDFGVRRINGSVSSKGLQILGKEAVEVLFGGGDA